MYSIALPPDPFWRIVTLVALGLFVLSWFLMFIWTLHDSTRRTGNLLLQILYSTLVLLFHFIGLSIYLMFRPRKTTEEIYYQHLEHEALAATLDDEMCSHCQSHITGEYAFCTQCGHKLRSPCKKCKKLLKSTWLRCPYCGQSIAREKSKP